MKIHQKKLAENQQDAFFYDGLIAETKDFKLSVSGDVKLTCDCKPVNDKEVDYCFDNGHFTLNNWYEIYPKNDDDKRIDFDCQDSACGRYDQAIKTLKDYQDLLNNNN